MTKKTVVNVTNHARRRYVERTSVVNFVEDANSAFYKGYKPCRFFGDFNDFLMCRPINYGKQSVRVYEGRIYVFENETKTLLTLWNVPEEFGDYRDWLISTGSPCLILVKTTSSDVVRYVGPGNQIVDDIMDAVEFKTESRARNYISNNRTLKWKECHILKL